MYFNTSYVTVQPSNLLILEGFFYISIHPMLRFNIFSRAFKQSLTAFQYILCYGSTSKSQISPVLLIISIHPMLRFNSTEQSSSGKGIPFQYILCYGSTITLTEIRKFQKDFNTSYVTVQPFLYKRKHFLT